MEKRTAILIGATGLVGSFVLDELIKNGTYEKIIVLSRRAGHYTNKKIAEIVTDFDNLQQLESNVKGHDLFCCLGTTIKKAGSQAAFRKVDYELPVILAEIALRNNINRFIVISSIGANPVSRNFYLRTKGEMEQALLKILAGKVFIVRPSMLLGKRNEFRMGEVAGKWVIRILNPLFIGRLAQYKGIHASDVARAMIYIALHGSEKQIVESYELQNLSKL